MKVEASFVQVRYKTFEETSTSGLFAAVEKTVNVYNGKATKATAKRAVPEGGTLIDFERVSYVYDVDGEEAIKWLEEHNNAVDPQ